MNPALPPTLFIRGLCLLLLSLLSISCATRPKSAADWNSLKIWQQVANHPPTYVPTGYGVGQSRTDRDGTWFTDQRDGKRLFVPKQAVRGLEPGVLTGEAKKATGYDGKPRLSPREKICYSILYFFAALGRTQLPPPD
jgi:hypothetical protein